MKSYMLVVTALVASLLGGCASFAQHEVKEAGKMPDVAAFDHKPSAYVEFKFYAGNPDQSAGAVEMVQAYTKLKPVVTHAVETSGLFSSCSLNEMDQDKMDYVIKLRAYNHGSGGAAMASGFLTGFTLGVIPGAATDNYTVLADVYNKQGQKVAQYRNKDSITTWIGLWFIPMAGNTPEKALTATLENQIRDILKKAVEEQKLNYSMQQQLPQQKTAA